ncbi:MAG: exo-alpha-sialidase [Verrucomicrobiota bacterium]
MKIVTIVLVMLRILGLVLLSFSFVSAETTRDSWDFEIEELKGWTLFRDGTTPNVDLFEFSNGGKALRGQRSEDGGLVALSRGIKPAERVLIEFSFAFSEGKGRSLNVWTHEPGGKDASQFNLRVEGGTLGQYDGRYRSWEVITSKVKASSSIEEPVWHRLQAIVDSKSRAIEYRVSAPGSVELPNEVTAIVANYRTDLPIAAIDFVSGTRIASDNWYLIDNLVLLSGTDIPAPGKLPPPPEAYELWTGSEIPEPEEIPFAENIEHRVIHSAAADGYKFLHGAAIIHHKDQFFANWANSPVNENGPEETLQGRRSKDGASWSDLEVIGPGFETLERHSHGVLMSNGGQLWTFCSRFGVGVDGRKFDGLHAEAFVLDEASDKWISKGPVMDNCWPYDEPVKMANGNYITGGQDKDGYPVVAFSEGEDFTNWTSVLIPFPKELAPSFAETTVFDAGDQILAVIRGGRGYAWVSTSDDFGKTWKRAMLSNLPMPRAKAYLGRLSTGQMYLVSNLKNRDTLVISVGDLNEHTLSRMWRLRHGRSEAPRFPGHAKAPQWSYPYAHEHDGNLYVVYSIGKEDCGLTIVPIESVSANP